MFIKGKARETERTVVAWSEGWGGEKRDSTGINSKYNMSDLIGMGETF